jgi:hypothetical protein
LFPATFRQPEVVVQSVNKLGKGNILGRPAQDISALDAALTRDEVLMAQFLKDICHESRAQAEFPGDGLGATPLPFAVQIGKDQQGIIDLSTQKAHESAPIYYDFYLYNRSVTKVYQGREYQHPIVGVKNMISDWLIPIGLLVAFVLAWAFLLPRLKGGT